MKTACKPDRYNSVSPYFIVPEAQKFIDMLGVIFDAKELGRYENPDRRATFNDYAGKCGR